MSISSDLSAEKSLETVGHSGLGLVSEMTPEEGR
jgi:hypothetical protein